MRSWLALIAATTLLAGCGQPAPGAGTPTALPVREQELIVFAASDLQFSLTAVTAAFAANGPADAPIGFGATGTASEVMETAARAAVFSSAAACYLTWLEQSGVIAAGTRQLYAIGRIVLVERAGVPPVVTLAD